MNPPLAAFVVLRVGSTTVRSDSKECQMDLMPMALFFIAKLEGKLGIDKHCLVRAYLTSGFAWHQVHNWFMLGISLQCTLVEQ